MLERGKEALPGVGMTFILAERRTRDLFVVFSDQFKCAKVIQHRDPAAGEDLHPFFGEIFIAIRKVSYRADRSIRVVQGKNHVIAVVLLFVRQRRGLHGYWCCPHQEGEKINEVAAFANNASASLLRIVKPVVRRKVTGVDSVLDKKRFTSYLNEFRQSNCHWCEASVIPHGQQWRI